MGKRKASASQCSQPEHDDAEQFDSRESSGSTLSTSSSSSSSGSSNDKVECDRPPIAADDGETGPQLAPEVTQGRRRRSLKSSKGRSTTDEKDDLDESNVVHAKIRRQAESQGWTNRPDNVRDLFLWPEFNASRLLEDRPVDSDTKVADLKRLLHFLSHDIEVHEAYGGTGNGATTLHRQITALQHVSSRLAKDCSWPAMSLFFSGNSFRFDL